MASRVLRNHIQNSKRASSAQTELDKPSKEELPNFIHPGGKLPPSVGSTSSAAPERIDQVASVTRNGWSFRIAMINPFTIPTIKPIITIKKVQSVAVTG